MENEKSDLIQMKQDIKTIKDKIDEIKKNKKPSTVDTSKLTNIEKDEMEKMAIFEIEMTMAIELPELFDQYKNLIKRLIKSNNDTILNKMLNALEDVTNGEKTLAAVELSLGRELFDTFVDPVLKNK
jgi:hypothetical protein